jgi:hypothetical protein
MSSVEVHKIYPSASAASREVPGAFIAAKIVAASETKRKDGREYAGFFLRSYVLMNLPKMELQSSK